MIYYDSLKNTCHFLKLSIPFDETHWPSSYVGDTYLDFNCIQKDLPSTIGNQCLESAFEDFSSYYYTQSGMKHNLTDLCFLFVDWVLSRSTCGNCSAEDYFNQQYSTAPHHFIIASQDASAG